ncbi:hypothetical protein [Porphyromonas levii]|uniref:hypothetical protein n=1 Tax=Porphyromonas levii TaxID=28114 RepID=UPI001B8A9FD0|nr:hypothetical protein [Porphyromonas levii]MBR8712315.1 hypothetical protein [Porphyromonas levii]MBR8714218.1 hypothetical protein [Porphyromonas levii]MBR8726760.1 hypothetical protein [Porphyromonas levii]MBR8735065.1 hypothetical protein [Porphyromonas levii]MBR8758974.1 hypothetical protein [Porphyromonas levii]
MDAKRILDLAKTMSRYDEVTGEREYIRMIKYIDIEKLNMLSKEMLDLIKSKASVFDVSSSSGECKPTLMIKHTELEKLLVPKS